MSTAGQPTVRPGAPEVEARAAGRASTGPGGRTARETERAERAQRRDTERAGRRGRDSEDGYSTRRRIQDVGLELFTDQGYEATSLREIAERLGVTKAALYYHFKTKDEIIDSILADLLVRIEELISWAHTQPRVPATRHEFLRRYSAMLHDGGRHSLMRFFERNQPAMAARKAGEEMRQRMTKILDLLSEPEDPLADRVRASLAIFALHAAWFMIRDTEITDDQRRAAALEVALDLLDRRTASDGNPAG